MNGHTNAATERYLGTQSSGLSSNGSIPTGLEAPTTTAAGVENARQASESNAGPFAGLREGIAGLGIGRGKGTQGSRSPGGGTKEMEVEMQ
jgi:hypothetical protein